MQPESATSIGAWPQLYTGDGERLSPPAPVTDTTAGCPKLSYVKLSPPGTVTVVTLSAFAIVKFFESLDPLWFPSPAYEASARYVPALVGAVVVGPYEVPEMPV